MTSLQEQKTKNWIKWPKLEVTPRQNFVQKI